MAKATKPKDEDEAQSQRFMEAARAVEADGGLNPTEAARAVDRLLSNTARLRTQKRSR